MMLKEVDFIRTLLKRVPHRETPQGPGDDAALLSTEQRVLGADALVEGVHFLRSHPPEWLGWKALAVNLSDISAMGVEPEAFAFTVALPQETPPTWWERFADGMGEYARLTHTHLVGGDVVRSPGPIFLSISAWGSTRTNDALLERTKVEAGDILFIKGSIGSSNCGLNRWMAMAAEGFWEGSLPDVSEDVLAHLRPSPPVWAGAKALSLGARAGIDLSDGLSTDLGHMARASTVGIVVDLDRLPLTEAARELNDHELVSAGEDYALAIFAPSRLTHEFEALGFVPVGRAVEGQPQVRFQRNGHPLNLRTMPFEHFDN
jgi:thiamine-monophosphate kinase